MGHSSFSSRKKNINAIGFLFLFVFLTYLPVFSSGFINWDDDAHLVKNPFVHSLDAQGISDIFSTTVNKIYIPLTTLSFAVENHFFGLNPFVYHLDNFLLHFAVTIMVFLFSRRCGLGHGASLVAALLFGIHPIHVESVAWITERKDVLYGFFYMLSLLFYCRYLQSFECLPFLVDDDNFYRDNSDASFSNCGPDNQRRKFIILSFIFGLLSVLSKPMALSLPFICLLLDWYFRRRFSLFTLIEKFFLGLLLFPAVWMTYYAQMRVPIVRVPESVLLWLWSLTFYLKKFFYPDYFVVIYKAPTPIGFANPAYLFSLIFLGLLIFSIFYYRKNRVYLFALAFYFMSIFYLLRWDLKADANVVADRFMYIASVGLCMWIGMLAEQYYRKFLSKRSKHFLILLFILFTTLLCLRTFYQCQIWRNSIALWENQLQEQGNVATALIYSKLGDAHMEVDGYLNDPDQVDKIIEYLTLAIYIRPDFANAYYYLGKLYFGLGDTKMAYLHLKKAISVDQLHFEAYFILGLLYQRQGNIDGAIEAFESAIQINPQNSEILRRVLRVYTNGAEEGPSAEIYRRAKARLFDFLD